MSNKTRLEDVKRFYEILGKLERRVGGRKILAKCSRSLGLSYGGVYFLWRVVKSGPKVARV